MNTNIEITGVGVTEAAHRDTMQDAADLADAWEDIFSRFRPGSTLNRVNTALGHATHVEPIFIDVLRRSVRAVAETGGCFDPSILPALEAIGYDRSFEEPQFARDGGQPPRSSAPADWVGVELDVAARTVRLPEHMRLDFGGIAKGAFVDMMSQRLQHWPGGCVSAGGDMLIWGVPPSGDRWLIGVEDPADASADLATISVSVTGTQRIGIATSGINRRRWSVAGTPYHHLIDPRSGTSVESEIVAVTVVAHSAVDAEVTTKALLVGSAHAAEPNLMTSELAILVDQSRHLSVYHRSSDHAEICTLP